MSTAVPWRWEVDRGLVESPAEAEAKRRATLKRLASVPSASAKKPSRRAATSQAVVQVMHFAWPNWSEPSEMATPLQHHLQELFGKRTVEPRSAAFQNEGHLGPQLLSKMSSSSMRPDAVAIYFAGGISPREEEFLNLLFAAIRLRAGMNTRLSRKTFSAVISMQRDSEN